MAKKKNRVLNFFKETKGELKKVVWPSFKQVKNNTFIVILCVLIIGAFIWLLDIGFTTCWSFANPPAHTAAEYSEAGIRYNMFFRTFVDEDSKEKITETEADAKVEAAKAGETATEDAAMTEEEAMLMMMEMAGIKVDEATGKFFDVETEAELTEEEVTQRLEALSAEMNTAVEETEAESAENEAKEETENKDN